VRIYGVRIEGIPEADCPRHFRSHLPGILCVEVDIEEVERFILCYGKGLKCGGSHPINELRQVRISHGGNVPFAEVIIIQTKDADIRPKPQFVSAVRPGQIVIDEKAARAPSLHPRVIYPSDVREWRVRTLALQHNRKGVECLLVIAWFKQA